MECELWIDSLIARSGCSTMSSLRLRHRVPGYSRLMRELFKKISRFRRLSCVEMLQIKGTIVCYQPDNNLNFSLRSFQFSLYVACWTGMKHLKHQSFLCWISLFASPSQPFEMRRYLVDNDNQCPISYLLGVTSRWDSYHCPTSWPRPDFSRPAIVRYFNSWSEQTNREKNGFWVIKKCFQQLDVLGIKGDQFREALILLHILHWLKKAHRMHWPDRLWRGYD